LQLSIGNLQWEADSHSHYLTAWTSDLAALPRFKNDCWPCST